MTGKELLIVCLYATSPMQIVILADTGSCRGPTHVNSDACGWGLAMIGTATFTVVSSPLFDPYVDLKLPPLSNLMLPVN